MLPLAERSELAEALRSRRGVPEQEVRREPGPLDGLRDGFRGRGEADEDRRGGGCRGVFAAATLPRRGGLGAAGFWAKESWLSDRARARLALLSSRATGAGAAGLGP